MLSTIVCAQISRYSYLTENSNFVQCVPVDQFSSGMLQLQLYGSYLCFVAVVVVAWFISKLYCGSVGHIYIIHCSFSCISDLCCSSMCIDYIYVIVPVVRVTSTLLLQLCCNYMNDIDITVEVTVVLYWIMCMLQQQFCRSNLCCSYSCMGLIYIIVEIVWIITCSCKKNRKQYSLIQIAIRITDLKN